MGKFVSVLLVGDFYDNESIFSRCWNDISHDAL